MENEKCLKKDVTKNYLINDIGFNASKHDKTNLSLSSLMEDECPRNGILSDDDCDLHESYECDYNSDCSLGSMDSLYLSFRDNETFLNSNRNLKQLLKIRNNLSETDDTNNLVARTHILDAKKLNDNVKNTKLEEKLSSVNFYGKQKSITRHNHTKLFYRHQRKKLCTNLKRRKTSNTICKFKYKVNRLQISLKNRYRKKNSLIQILDTKNIFQKNENLLRNELKKSIPLLQIRGKIKLQISQEIKKYSNPHKDNVTNHETISNEYRYIETQISELNLIDDFTDLDDFGGTKEIEDIIKRLFEEDNSIPDNEANY